MARKKRLTGEERADYINYNSWDPDFFWTDGEGWNKNWHSVVIDSKTGIAFTCHNVPGQPIPRLMLAEIIDQGVKF